MNVILIHTEGLRMEAEIEADTEHEALLAVREMIESGEPIGGQLWRGNNGRKDSLLLVGENTPYTLTTKIN